MVINHHVPRVSLASYAYSLFSSTYLTLLIYYYSATISVAAKSNTQSNAYFGQGGVRTWQKTWDRKSLLNTPPPPAPFSYSCTFKSRLHSPAAPTAPALITALITATAVLLLLLLPLRLPNHRLLIFLLLLIIPVALVANYSLSIITSRPR